MEFFKSRITLCQFPSLLFSLWWMTLFRPSDILILPLAMYRARRGTGPAPATWRISPLVDVVLTSREKWGLVHSGGVNVTEESGKTEGSRTGSPAVEVLLRGGVAEPAVPGEPVVPLGSTPAACRSLDPHTAEE